MSTCFQIKNKVCVIQKDLQKNAVYLRFDELIGVYDKTDERNEAGCFWEVTDPAPGRTFGGLHWSSN